ncbi:MAG: type VI secretion system-associated FHA domain protein TagH [Chromatiaceae bacterium]|nr:type VI secretion system-associated FHA domain protein TagH [Chromatiaceae bacterium]
MTIASAQARSLGPEATARFRLRGGTIGRSRDNDWVLPDPQRIVSGHHARILYEQGTYYAEDTSANGTYLNQADEQLPKGQPVALAHGDTLYVGDYEIRVELEEEPAHASAFTPDLVPPDSSGADFIAKPYTPETRFDENDKRTPGWTPGGRSVLPEAGRAAARLDVGVEPGGVPPRSDHLAAEKQHFRPPGATPELIPEDIPPPVSEVLPVDWWKTDEGSADSIEAPRAPAQAAASGQTGAPTPEPSAPPLSEESFLRGAEQLPGAAEQRPPAARTRTPLPPEPAFAAPQAAELESPPAAAGYRLVEAFFEGLGLPSATLSPEQGELLMRQTGRLLRMLTQGTIEVLQARSTLKGEFRLSQTIVRPSENNPLKFSLDADQALRQLFVDRRPGFMGAEAAFTEALKDIKQHEIAVVAGMRAAFECLLGKLAPEAVEAALRASGKRPSKLGFGDKTWDFYQSFYADFKANAGDDFQGIFGEDFVRAYEEQIAVLTSREHEG